MAGKQFKLDILISAVDKITAPLTRINNRVKQLTAPGRQLATSFASLRQESGLNTLWERAQRVASAVSDIGTAAMKSARRIAGIGVAGAGIAYLFKREFIDTAATFENLQVSLEAIEGSREKAATSMAFIKKLTLDTPMQLADITRAFRLMRGQGMDPMNGQLQALIDYTSKLGGSNEMLMSIATQLSQAWSKQKLQQQDIRVMAEEGVGVWGLLARAVERVSKGMKKISTKDLMAMSEKGQLGPKAILLLIEQMQIESQGASKRMMGTWTGMVSNLADQWTFFKLRVMQSGPFDRIKAVLAGILERINTMATNGQLQAWADTFAAKLERLFTWLEQNGPRILSEIWSNLQSIFSVADSIAQVFGGWGNFITLGIAAYIGGPLVASVFSLLAAIVALNGALIGTPAGLLLVGGAAVIGAAGAFVSFKSLHGLGTPNGEQRTDGNGLPLFNARALAAGVPPSGEATGRTPERAPFGSGLAYFNPFMPLPKEEHAAIAAMRQPAAPPIAITPPPARGTLALSPEDQQAIAAAFAGAQAQSASANAPQARLQVDIQHSNVPAGTKLRIKQSGNIPIDLSRGVSMAHAY